AAGHELVQSVEDGAEDRAVRCRLQQEDDEDDEAELKEREVDQSPDGCGQELDQGHESSRRLRMDARTPRTRLEGTEQRPERTRASRVPRGPAATRVTLLNIARQA